MIETTHDRRQVSAHEALRAHDAVLKGLRDRLGVARNEWENADPITMSTEALTQRKTRFDTLKMTLELVISVQIDIMGSTTSETP